ncbi:MAG: NADPH:quinone reductase [Frankiales bacterium]|jgi:NADPH2:quinone reductase|nr:NADPH:quinone reductase [Frankiales bacterium]
MRAARVIEHGEPSAVVTVEDVDAPEVTPGTVRVRVSTASLNYGDIARCRGGLASVMAQPPFTLGMDVCGTVEEAAEGLEQWVGKRVVGITPMAMGGLAEQALIPATALFEAPESLDDVQAAAFTLPFHISYLALVRRARLQPGEQLLVIGAASAVGTAAIQLGVAQGAHVIAAAGGPDKGKTCLELGAAVAIDSTSEDLFDAVMAATAGHGADVIFDVVGGQHTEAVWTCIAPEGRYLPVGFNDDVDGGMTGRPLRKVSMGNFSVVGTILAYNEPDPGFRRFGLNMVPPSVGKQVHEELAALVANGSITPYVGRVIAMGEVGTALDDHAARRTSGRTVVDVTR